MQILNHPNVLKEHVSHTNYNEAKALETFLIEQSKTKKSVEIERCADGKVMETFEAIFKKTPITSLTDVDFVLKNL
ncbi:hypothetical protein [Treponema sp.]|uniref:hypothetical protein n=1 Tax=Treponema sp. TaxID=166 RepID=UPI00257D265A|nr:hypothetical protein [Treponema sp.]MBE6354860.1 hypothetical protein [Treponema sp.]